MKPRVALCAFDELAIGHDARMAHRAREDPNLHFALFPNDIAIRGQNTVARHRSAGSRVPGGLAQEIFSAAGRDDVPVTDENRRIKNQLTGPYPISGAFEVWSVLALVPQDLGIELAQR